MNSPSSPLTPRQQILPPRSLFLLRQGVGFTIRLRFPMVAAGAVMIASKIRVRRSFRITYETPRRA